MPVPLITVGDSPRLHSGLARIARDVTARLAGEAPELDIDIYQLGIDGPGGWHFQGWPLFTFQPSKQDQGRHGLAQILTDLSPLTERPIVMTFMDPARVFDLVRVAPPPSFPGEPPVMGYEVIRQLDVWSYFPVDCDPVDRIGGPAGYAIEQVDRVLAYGKYGASVLQRNRPGAISYLPHGIETRVFKPTELVQADPAFQSWVNQLPATTPIIGCVATNQPRKDHGWAFATIAALRRRGIPCAYWVHTDRMTHAWDMGELATQFALRREDVLVSTGELPDAQLAARYTASAATIAPGLGEGFGYPIVESLSCGTAPIHVNYAGGVELMPNRAWLVEPCAWRLESIYAVKRPVLNPEDGATVLEKILKIVQHNPDTMQGYCRGSVQYLDWEHVWPRWRSWFRKGLHERPRRGGDTLGSRPGERAAAGTDAHVRHADQDHSQPSGGSAPADGALQPD